MKWSTALDWSALGSWAGDKGPFVGIIVLQWGVISKLLNRFFQQQEAVMKSLHVAERTASVAERVIEDK